MPESRRLTPEDRPGPRRTCIGCRRVRSQAELVRLVRGDDGSLRIGRTLPGRGAWLCADTPGCVTEAQRRKAFGRALRASINPESVESVRRGLLGRIPGTP